MPQLTTHERQILALTRAVKKAKTPQAAEKIKARIREVKIKQQQQEFLAQ